MAHHDAHTTRFYSATLPPPRANRAAPGEMTGGASNAALKLRRLLAEYGNTVELIPIHTNNMRASGLLHGGLAVIDKNAKLRLGDIAAVRFNGLVVIRRLEKRNGRFCLVTDDPREEILFVEGAEIERLGNVIGSLFQS